MKTEAWADRRETRQVKMIKCLINSLLNLLLNPILIINIVLKSTFYFLFLLLHLMSLHRVTFFRFHHTPTYEWL